MITTYYKDFFSGRIWKEETQDGYRSVWSAYFPCDSSFSKAFNISGWRMQYISPREKDLIELVEEELFLELL